MTTSTASKIHVGRVVHYFAGYGSIDGRGAIVKVHGTPAEDMPQGRMIRVILPDHCRVDVILFDGRHLKEIHQCSIDRPGIGIKLLDETFDDTASLYAKAAEKETNDAIAAAKQRTDFETREAARVIENPPVFYYNGIKDQKGAKLQKCFYSSGELRSYPPGTITIYARDYCSFSPAVRVCFAVQNETDTQVDYFDQDKIRVIPAHPLYGAVFEAMNKSRNR